MSDGEEGVLLHVASAVLEQTLTQLAQVVVLAVDALVPGADQVLCATRVAIDTVVHSSLARAEPRSYTKACQTIVTSCYSSMRTGSGIFHLFTQHTCGN